MSSSAEFRMDQLPADPLLHVLSFLGFRDLVHADRLQSGVSWFCLFKQYYRDLGRYVQYYPVLKSAWEQLKSFLQQRCPRMIASLKEGATEVELNDIEAQIGCRLPDDYRCSYRIHNGQKLVIPGLMGSMSLSNHYRSEVLLDVETAAGGFQQKKGMRRCLPLTFCFHTGLSQYMALQPAEGRRMFESFYPCPVRTLPVCLTFQNKGSCFVEWFTGYVHNVVAGEFPIIRDQIFRIEMSSSALPEAACQLDSRYWRITTSDGNVEEVQGPGVVGEFPVMTPGKVHEYASCTTFSTPSEYMEGHYTFHRLANKEEVFQVAIPRFHMVCPPFREPLVRTQRASTSYMPRFDDHDDDGEYWDGDGDDFGDLRQSDVAAGAWCPRHI
ncbi:F-box only protein 3 [Collichthys lucidus]|uniref:F-box only protein 3 n=1 Tax=Collichthys lucidus TaxID=240159 RepID=A0A4U5U1I7_COLLU|nr:F-box only protein 3 [Collichthys lucidus]